MRTRVRIIVNIANIANLHCEHCTTYEQYAGSDSTVHMPFYTENVRFLKTLREDLGLHPAQHFAQPECPRGEGSRVNCAPEQVLA